MTARWWAQYACATVAYGVMMTLAAACSGTGGTGSGENICSAAHWQLDILLLRSSEFTSPQATTACWPTQHESSNNNCDGPVVVGKTSRLIKQHPSQPQASPDSAVCNEASLMLCSNPLQCELTTTSTADHNNIGNGSSPGDWPCCDTFYNAGKSC